MALFKDVIKKILCCFVLVLVILVFYNGAMFKSSHGNSLMDDGGKIVHRKKSDRIDSAYAQKYNLLESDVGKDRNDPKCTKEFMNANKLAQDHPCVIDIIRRDYLSPPSPRNVPYNLLNINHTTSDLSQIGAPTKILSLLKNKTGGFLIECGALDGEFLSNSLYMEHTMNWEGILIEPNPEPYKKMVAKNRKMWTAPVCLSLKPYPTTADLTYLGESNPPGFGWIRFIPSDSKDPKKVTVQCFPIYSILLALNRTRVDFFSLDLDGFELEVLKTVPFRKVDIRTWAIEAAPMRSTAGLHEEFTRFMDESGFLKVGHLGPNNVPQDEVFIKDTLNV